MTAGNSDNIKLTVSHPGANKGGQAVVRVNVIGSEGQSLSPEPLRITFAGTARQLAIAQPSTTLLGYAPTESTDLRNKTALVVSATDANDNRATVPSSRYSAKLTGPDGHAIALTGANRRAEIEWPLRKGGSGADADDLVLSGGNPQARVTILAGAAAPLAAGEYTLELTAGSGSAKLSAKQSFSVSGGAAAVALSADPTGEAEEGDSITLTAAVTDASGGAVPDGTPVRFSEQSTGESVAVVLLSPSRQLTRDGQASVTLRAINRGGAYVTAEAGGVSGVRSITVTAADPTEEQRTGFSASLSSTTPSDYSVWLDQEPIRGSELLAGIQGVRSVLLWRDSVWVRFAVTDAGLVVPGSMDFRIPRGAVLWLGE